MGRIKTRVLRRRPASAAPPRIPASGVVVDLMAPFMPKRAGPAERGTIKALASLAAAAWSVSRFEREATAKAEADAALLWATALGQLPHLAEIAEAMLAQARTMYPEEHFLILETHVAFDGDTVHVTATSVRLP